MQTQILKLKSLLICSILFILAGNPLKASEPLLPEGTNSNAVMGKLRTLSGYIKDSKNGEALIAATIYVHELKKASVANMYGFYSISMLPGTYNIDFSYVGYATISKKVDLTENQTITIELSDEAFHIGEVVVKAEGAKESIKRAEMSVQKLEMKAIKKIPAFMGEVDVIKVIQMLPGVQSTAEGTSGFSVRGGSADQNLIILDEATVYNASHLMGFFSTFNNDAIKDVKLYKGDIPASQGGRLSSLLDVRMKDGNSKECAVSGGIGLLSSRLTVEGPIIRDTTSFIVTGRRTYYDMFFPLFGSVSPEIAESKLYFYDLNAKINHQLDEKNRLYLSGYFGNDVFDYNGMFGLSYGNRTGTLRWNHQYSPRLFSNASFIVSRYNYRLGSESSTADFLWKSYLQDYSLKLDYFWYPNASNTVKFGVSSTHHTINPAYITGADLDDPFTIPNNYALEHGIYISNEQSIGERLQLKYGLRMSIFQNLGEGTEYKFDSNYNLTETIQHKKNEIYKTRTGLEPRLAMAYQLYDGASVKASYSRTFQYMQLASNSTGGTPLDIWFFSSPYLKPQEANQVAAGFFQNFANNAIETSVELFYKEMDNAIDFKDNAVLLFKKNLEGEVRIGNAVAKGAEFMLKYDINKFNGWVSYTYSITKRKIDEINNGNWYFAPYDKPHSINCILSYDYSNRISFAASWVYSTGSPVTFPSFRYEIDGMIQKGYTERNSYRLPAYHRLDVSVTIKPKESYFNLLGRQRIWQGEWVLGIYNVYNRKNVWMVNFADEPDMPGAKYAEKISILPFMPSVTYNFKF